MSAAALLLVLAAALVHATWNLLAKRVSATTSAPAFVWLYGALSAALYTPAALWVLARDRPSLGAVELGLMAGSALVHLAYFLVLQRGYRDGDLSVVYPLARGTGPLLSAAAAVVLLGERPSALAVAGMLLVVLGVLLFAAPSGGRPHGSRRAGVAFGLGTGVLIAAYTVWDKYAVATRGISPLLMEWATSLARVLVLAPVAWRQRVLVREAWARHRGAALGVGALNPLSYLLVMVAMRTTPVAYLAPAREVSILVGAVMGARILKEGDVARRLAAAAVMLLGVLALAAG
jgi:drug/metabolite transporter (DMT)-like permease